MQVKATLPKDHFHIGEVISVQLEVSSSRNDLGQYSFSDGNIEFRAEGADGAPVANPMEWYYGHYIQFSPRPSGERMIRPWVSNLAANFALRFDKAGTYTFYVVLQGMEPGSDKGPDGKPIHPPVPVTDPIRITIEPRRSPPEEQAIIDEAKKTLADAPATGFIDNNDPGFDAIERLRFLETPAAADALLPYIGTKYGGEAVLGIYARPDYAAIAAKILAGVKAGSLPISDRLLYLYRDLKTGGDFLSFGNPDGHSLEEAARAELLSAAAQATATPEKGKVNFENLVSLFLIRPDDAAARTLLVKNQLDLPQKQIDDLLHKEDSPSLDERARGTDNEFMPTDPFDMRHFSKIPEKGSIVSPEFLPLLRELVKPEKHDAYALAALAVLVPEEARPIIIEDLKRRHPIYVPAQGRMYFSPADALFAHRTLPKGELPELDPILREKLAPPTPISEDDLDAVMVLIERYATKALLPDVIRVYQPKEGRCQCELQTAALRYWIRCDPAGGVEALRRAMQHAGPQDTGCLNGALNEVLSKAWTPEALPLLRSVLESEDGEPIRDAASLLAAHAPGPETTERIIAAAERIAAKPRAADAQHYFYGDGMSDGLIHFLLNRRKEEPRLTRAQLLRLQKIARDEQLRSRIAAVLAKEMP